MTRLGFVTGMASEADCLRRVRLPNTAPDHRLTFCAGGSPGRAEAGARTLLRDGAVGLVSFGIAGGLDPDLATGDIVLARAVVAPHGEAYETDIGWIDHLAKLLEPAGRVSHGAIATVERAIVTPGAKRQLRQHTGASIVDMESSGVAATAAHAGVPFVAVRVVADTAGQSLPSAALLGLAPDGTTRPFAVLAALMARPWEMVGLCRLAVAHATALRSLSRVAALDLRLTR